MTCAAGRTLAVRALAHPAPPGLDAHDPSPLETLPQGDAGDVLFKCRRFSQAIRDSADLQAGRARVGIEPLSHPAVPRGRSLLRLGDGRLLALTVDQVVEEVRAGLYRDPETIGRIAATVPGCEARSGMLSHRARAPGGRGTNPTLGGSEE